ncbi:diguanylate cyclase [Aquisalimonas lutea]|uniref:GGDEF domain-containing protein n=1 Tax=Aquisalimonas lutea TaxID=1327750 RepID=UPI0025B297F0|nr:diguanylate cyclase [Aquisalimonas lutea]MDN3516215.1 diguanylate cyclase [Aquisalimonas lutea]
MTGTSGGTPPGGRPGSAVDIAGLHRAWDQVADSGDGIGRVHERAAALADTARAAGEPRIAELAVMVGLLCEPVVSGEETVTREFRSTVNNYIEALDRAHEERERAAETEEHTPVAHGRICLLADDGDHGIQELIRQLEHFGYTVVLAADDAGLLDEVRRVVPLAVIVDHDHLPNDSVLGQLPAPLRRAAGDNLPVLALSSSGGMTYRLYAARAGIQVYLVKPVSTHDLIDQLEQFAPATPPEPLSILLVEDSRTQATYFASILEQAGMRVRTVADPLRVLDTLQEESTDLILMDMYMPQCNGHELARVVRQVPRYASIPIVFLSSETQVDRQLDAMSRGGDDFLVKPIEPGHLIRSVAIRAERARTLRSLMVTDNLTGLLNHTRIKEELDNEVNRTRRRGGTLAFVMLDIDHFKAVNDSHGHPAGDAVLRSLARLLQQRLRRSDAIGRYGGEEFAIIMPDADAESAAGALESIRRSFASLYHDGHDGPFRVTFSAGVAAFPAHETRDRITLAADSALYRAKEQGRNRIVLAE